MKFSYLMFVGLILTSLPINGEHKLLSLMPIPKSVTQGTGNYHLDDSFSLSIAGDGAGTRIESNATRFLRRLSARTGLFFRQGNITTANQPSSASFSIVAQRPGYVKLNEDESYELTVTTDKISLVAPTDIGILRGLETLLQLLDSDDIGYIFPVITISDEPRFPWRGLMIDASRHFMPVDMIKRNLDGMAAVKLNIMHWHLSDDQGVRVESKQYPLLQQRASDGDYYTQIQLKEIIEYAGNLGIRVMPEFDVPAHSTSWIYAYPELGSAEPPDDVERHWGIFNATMDPTKETTYTFIGNFFEEMMTIFTDDYFHIGGDENNGEQWKESKRIKRFMADQKIKDNHMLQAHFNRRLLKILSKGGKKMVGWDEIYQPDLPKDIVIHSWRGRDGMIESAKRGFQSILSNGYYIDLIHPTDQHYLNDPIPLDSPLTTDQKKQILGGEATMWTEYVSHETVDSRIWPRTAAIAERFWSPGSVKDVDDMYRRLDAINYQLEEHGLQHIKNYEMNLRRLTGNRDTEALRRLIDVIEPVKGYERGQLREFTSFSPLTRVVDTARPDAATARRFRRLAKQCIASNHTSNTSMQQIRTQLVIWAANHAQLLPTIKASPILWEIETLSADFSNLAQVGLATLEIIEGRGRVEKKWLKASRKTLKRAAKELAQTRLRIVSAIELLVEYAANL